MPGLGSVQADVSMPARDVLERAQNAVQRGQVRDISASITAAKPGEPHWPVVMLMGLIRRI